MGKKYYYNHDWKDWVLITILDCSFMELDILDGINYDIEDIMCDYYNACNQWLTYNALMKEIIIKGLSDIDSSIKNRITVLEDIIDNNEDNTANITHCREVLEKLKELNVYDDFTCEVNGCDIYITCILHNDIYTDYCGTEIDEFQDNIGLYIHM